LYLKLLSILLHFLLFLSFICLVNCIVCVVCLLLPMEGSTKQEPLPWIETLDITTEEPTTVENVHDDLQRELAFYSQALEGVIKAHGKFKELNINYKRPNDYFAEMLKSDQHMEKVRGRLISEQKSIDEADERKKQKEMKKYGKQLQVQQLQEKQKKKKAEIQSIQKWRKYREHGKANLDDDEFPMDIETEDKAKKGPFNQRQQLNKKKMKDEKYGFGGKKKRSKGNTSESTSDISHFNSKRNKQANSDVLLRVKKTTMKKTKRPGKSARKAKK